MSAAVRFVAELVAFVATFVTFQVVRPSAPFDLPWLGSIIVALCVAAFVGLAFNLKVSR